MSLATTTAIAVMAKAPRAGQTKTRLMPPLDAESAAALSAAFLRDVTANIALAARQMRIAGAIAYAPEGTEKLFDGVPAGGTFLVLADGSIPMSPRVQGIGRSLVHAVSALLAAGYGAACLLNADSPNLPTDYLCRAAGLLMRPGDRVVLGPAEDGGYYLIGMKQPHAVIFEDIAWSTDRVATQTRARARQAGLELVELPAWYDVDDHEGLQRLVRELESPPRGAYAACATMACLKALRTTGAVVSK